MVHKKKKSCTQSVCTQMGYSLRLKLAFEYENAISMHKGGTKTRHILI